MLEDPNNRGSEVKANDMEGNKTQGDQNQRRAVVTGFHDDTTAQEVQDVLKRNHNYDTNVNGSKSEQMSSQADNTCVLAVHRQRRKRQVCQISKHVEERVGRTENKDITSHRCRRNISSEKTWILQTLHSYKTREDRNEQIDKTCIGRRTDSGQNMRKWVSQVPQLSRH